MKLFRKNQIVITALAALIAVAGYLNHVEKTEKQGTLAGTGVTKETGEKESVLPVNAEAENGQETQETGEDFGGSGTGYREQ